MHDDPRRPARPHGDGRLHIEIALDQTLAGAIRGRSNRLLEGLDEIAIATAARADSELAADTEDGRQGNTLEQLPGVDIDIVGEAGVTRRCRWRADCR